MRKFISIAFLTILLLLPCIHTKKYSLAGTITGYPEVEATRYAADQQRIAAERKAKSGIIQAWIIGGCILVGIMGATIFIWGQTHKTTKAL